MAWDNDFPLSELAQKLVETRLRVERVRLAQGIQSLETRIAFHGGTAEELTSLRKALNPPSPPKPDRVDAALVLPRKPAGVWRRTYLTVQTKPGSVF